MNELTYIYKDTAFTNSLIISKGAGADHRSTYLLIEKYKAELEEFGKVSFEMIPLKGSTTGQKIKVYRLNEEQATFLISLMRNTKPVVDFKKELVKQFYQMKSFIYTLIAARKEFPLLTENIKLIHENPKPYHFSNECDMINRIVTGMSARLSGTPNQMNIQSMYSDIDLDANDMETELQTAFEDILWFVNAHLANTGRGNFENEDVTVIFNRDILINETEAIANCQASVGLLSGETIIGQHPWIDDPQLELERLEKQRQKEQEEAENQYDPFRKKDNVDEE